MEGRKKEVRKEGGGGREKASRQERMEGRKEEVRKEGGEGGEEGHFKKGGESLSYTMPSLRC